MINFNDMVEADRRPTPYEQGEELWSAPHISKMMLEAHLSPDTDSASYKPGKIRAICEYLPFAMHLQKGDSIVDLGCGPGLYCSLLAQKGFLLTGIDASENSIQYARKLNSARNTIFIHASYLKPFASTPFDAAMLIYEDYGVLSPANRKTLLQNIHSALKPNGHFTLDVSSLTAFSNRKGNSAPKWYAADSGFWRPHPHFVLEKIFFYEDICALCDLVAVVDSKVKIYRIWQSFFSPESIQAELEENGFKVEAILSNLHGDQYSADSPVIGVICSKA
ncbi:class I SAM-dependent methyltransferase [Oscillospiraceae bacterium PP1C4]